MPTKVFARQNWSWSRWSRWPLEPLEPLELPLERS
jgi:hypothetical protein